MLSIPLDIQHKVHDPNPKHKYNVFMHRMKKYNFKQSPNIINSQNQSINLVRPLPLKNKSSIQKFLAFGEKQQSEHEKNPNPNTSENLRQTTLSPRSRKSYTNYTKKQNNQLQHMPEISQAQKNKNISIILSTSYKRPLWKSLQMYNPKKNSNNNTNKCNIFKKNRQQGNNILQNPEIQFYTTSNIFIFKKLNAKIHQLDKKKQISSNSNNIRYNNSFKEQIIYGNSARLSSQRMRYFFSQSDQKNLQLDRRNQIKTIKKNLQRIQEPLIKPVKIKQKQDLSVRGLQNKFIDGIYGLQPWNFTGEDQGQNFIRLSHQNNQK